MKKAKGILLKNKKSILIIGGIIIIVLIIFKLFFGSKKSQSQYQTATVERGTIVSSISTSGQILNANYATVTTQASGTVKEIYVKDGDVIAKGDKIAEISLDQQGQQKNAAAWASYLSAKNTFDNAQVSLYTLQSDMFSKWKTYYNLATSSTYQNSDGTPNDTNRALVEFHITQNDWLAAEAKYKNQQSSIAQAQASLNSAWYSYQLTTSTVTAPTDGNLSNLGIVEGMVINTATGTSTTNSVSNQQIAIIKNEYKPLATFNLSEIDIPKVKPGQKATITLDSISDKTFTGIVKTVDRIGTTTSGVTNYSVIVQFDSGINQILPNMATTANIILDSKNDVLYVPSAAVQISNDQTYVRVLKNGKEQDVNVETGLTSDTQTEITSGLKEGDTMIIGTTTTTTTSNGSNRSSSPFSGMGGGVMRMGR